MKNCWSANPICSLESFRSSSNWGTNCPPTPKVSSYQLELSKGSRARRGEEILVFKTQKDINKKGRGRGKILQRPPWQEKQVRRENCWAHLSQFFTLSHAGCTMRYQYCDIKRSFPWRKHPLSLQVGQPPFFFTTLPSPADLPKPPDCTHSYSTL